MDILDLSLGDISDVNSDDTDFLLLHQVENNMGDVNEERFAILSNQMTSSFYTYTDESGKKTYSGRKYVSPTKEDDLSSLGNSFSLVHNFEQSLHRSPDRSKERSCNSLLKSANTSFDKSNGILHNKSRNSYHALDSPDKYTGLAHLNLNSSSNVSTEMSYMDNYTTPYKSLNNSNIDKTNEKSRHDSPNKNLSVEDQKEISAFGR